MLRLCIHEESLYQSFYWSSLIPYTYNTDIMSMCLKKCHAKKYFWQSDCLSNLAILYALCILDSSFLYWSLLCRGYLTSIAYFSFHCTRFFSGVWIVQIFVDIFQIFVDILHSKDVCFQIKKLLAKVVSRDTLNYRKLTDRPEQEDPDETKPHPMEVDADKLVSGMPWRLIKNRIEQGNDFVTTFIENIKKIRWQKCTIKNFLIVFKN